MGLFNGWYCRLYLTYLSSVIVPLNYCSQQTLLGNIPLVRVVRASLWLENLARSHRVVGSNSIWNSDLFTVWNFQLMFVF